MDTVTISTSKYAKLKQKLAGWIDKAERYRVCIEDLKLEKTDLENDVKHAQQETKELDSFYVAEIDRLMNKIKSLKTRNKELETRISIYEEEKREARLLERLRKQV